MRNTDLERISCEHSDNVGIGLAVQDSQAGDSFWKCGRTDSRTHSIPVSCLQMDSTIVFSAAGDLWSVRSRMGVSLIAAHGPSKRSNPAINSSMHKVNRIAFESNQRRRRPMSILADITGNGSDLVMYLADIDRVSDLRSDSMAWRVQSTMETQCILLRLFVPRDLSPTQRCTSAPLDGGPIQDLTGRIWSSAYAEPEQMTPSTSCEGTTTPTA